MARPKKKMQPTRRVQASPASDPGMTGPVLLQNPSEEDIRLVAYYRYLARGAAPASPVEDWLFAERELMSRAPAAS
ncbi:MAG: DUF2934 domain-containing protein [Myxococcales bacterium]|nr:DUF2934 domain-containing protein [Myxococcales bacterium]